MLAEIHPSSTRRTLYQQLTQDTSAKVMLTVVTVYMLTAIFTRWGVIGTQWQVPFTVSYTAPSTKYWLGTDALGRSLGERLLQGIEVAMRVGTVTSILTLIIGTLLGIIGGYFGGWMDTLIVGSYRTFTAIPHILLLVASVMVLKPYSTSLYITLLLPQWGDVCRRVRRAVLYHRCSTYIQAATVIGAGDYRKLFVHVIPNVSSLIIAQIPFLFQGAVKGEVILAYLGVGAPTSLGSMLYEAMLALPEGIWWQFTFPFTALVLILLACRTIGNTLTFKPVPPRLES